jgi:protein-S-isoprenylcysteine O-methyltransferase Ste14/rhodanese-related sulfurtransferase
LCYFAAVAVLVAVGFDTGFSARELSTYEFILVLAVSIPAGFLLVPSLFSIVSYFVFIPSISADGHLFSRVHGTHLIHPLTTSIVLALLAVCIVTGSSAGLALWGVLAVVYVVHTYFIVRRVRHEELANGQDGSGMGTAFSVLNLVLGGELITLAAGAKPLSPWRLNTLPEDIWIVDVRTKPEYHWNRMQGAENFPWGSGIIEAAKGIPRNRPVLVMCFSGHRSPAVAVMMKKLGFHTVYNLNWGILYLILLERGRRSEGPFSLTRSHRDPNRRGEDYKGISVGYVTLALLTLIVAPIESYWNPPAQSYFREIAGAVVGFGGLLLGWLSFRALGRNFRVFAAPRRSGSLVTNGVYSKVRHPMYTATIMAVGGYALYFGSLFSLPLWLGVVILYVIKAIKEERLLEHHYPGYAEYRKHTWRLIPFVY